MPGTHFGIYGSLKRDRSPIWDASLITNADGAIYNTWFSIGKFFQISRGVPTDGDPSDAILVTQYGRKGVFSNYNHFFITDEPHYLATGLHAFVYTYDASGGGTIPLGPNLPLFAVDVAIPPLAMLLTLEPPTIRNVANNFLVDATFNLPVLGSLTVIVTQWKAVGSTQSQCTAVVSQVDPGTNAPTGTPLLKKSPIQNGTPNEFNNHRATLGGAIASVGERSSSVVWHEIRLLKIPDASDAEMVELWSDLWNKWSALTTA